MADDDHFEEDELAELGEKEERNVYKKEVRESLVEDDEISPEEEAFMQGYDEADEEEEAFMQGYDEADEEEEA